MGVPSEEAVVESIAYNLWGLISNVHRVPVMQWAPGY